MYIRSLEWLCALDENAEEKLRNVINILQISVTNHTYCGLALLDPGETVSPGGSLYVTVLY